MIVIKRAIMQILLGFIHLKISLINIKEEESIFSPYIIQNFKKCFKRRFEKSREMFQINNLCNKAFCRKNNKFLLDNIFLYYEKYKIKIHLHFPALRKHSMDAFENKYFLI